MSVQLICTLIKYIKIKRRRLNVTNKNYKEWLERIEKIKEFDAMSIEMKIKMVFILLEKIDKSKKECIMTRKNALDLIRELKSKLKEVENEDKR